MAQVVSHRTPWRSGFAPGSVHVGFVMKKNGTKTHCPLSSSVYPCQHHSTVASILIILGMNNRPVGGSSLETVSPHRHEQQQHNGILEFRIFRFME